MKLKELLQGIHVLACTADLETEISSVAYDSRKVQPGGAFMAISGFTSDYTIGHQVVFRLGGWAPRIPIEFHVSVGTLDTRHSS